MALSTFFIKSFQLSALASALALAGCGGGSGGGNDTLMPMIPTGAMVSVTNKPNSNDTTTNTNIANVKNVQLVSTASSFYMANGTNVELTVYALNANNTGVANVPVNVEITDPKFTGVFSATPPNLLTDNTGKATLKLEVNSLSADQKKYLQDKGVVVKTTVGTISNTKTLKGTEALAPVVNNATVKDVLLVANTSNIPLTKGAKLSVTALAIDKDNNIIPNANINFNIGSSVLSGVFANNNLNATTNDKGEATIELEVKSLTNEQAAYLKETGLTIKSTAIKENITSNSLVLKGVVVDTNAAQKADVQAINLTTSIDKFNIKVGEKFTVTASVLNSNNTGLGGVPVEFKLTDNPSDTGVYAVSDTSHVITNANGEATIELEVKSEAAKQKLIDNGLAIEAFANNTMGSSPVRKDAKLTIKGIAPEQKTSDNNANKVDKVLLSSSVSEFDLTVGTKFKITASVADKAQGALSNVPVTFTLPSLDSTGIANLSGSTITTDAQGQATIELEVKSLTQQQRDALKAGFKVQARVPNGVNANELVLNPKVNDVSALVNSVAITADNDKIYMAAGSKVKVTAIALDNNFGGLANQTLSFKLPDPSITGVYNLSGSSITTNAQGEATIELTVKSNLTNEQKSALTKGLDVMVTAGNGKQGHITLTGQEVNQAQVANVTLTSNVSAINTSVGSRFKVTATVADSNNGTLANIPVTFTLPSLANTGVASLSPATVVTNEQGQATIELEVKSLTEEQKRQLFSGFNVNAIANSKPAKELRLLGQLSNDDKVSSIAMTADSSTLFMEAGTKLKVTAVALDKNFGGIANTALSFSLEPNPNLSGIFNNSGSVITTNDKGEATIELEIKSALSAEQKQALANGIIVTATSANGKSKQFNIAVKEAINAAVKNIALTSNINNIPLQLGQKFTVTAAVTDEKNGTIANTPVVFTLPYSLQQSGIVSLSGSTVVTNPQGQATIELEVRSLTAAQKERLKQGFVIQAVSNGKRATDLTLVAAPEVTTDSNIDSILIKPSMNNIVMQVGAKIQVIATILDKLKGGIANAGVYFELLDDPNLSGVFNNTGSIATTNAQGEAAIELEVKSLTDAQKDYLQKNGIKVKATAANNTNKSITTSAIQGVMPATNIDSIKFAPVDNFMIAKGQKFSVTAVVLDSKQGGVANALVDFSIPDPAQTGVYNLSGSQVVTNAQGQATIELEVKSEEFKEKLKNGIEINATTAGKSPVKLLVKGVDNSAISQVQSLVVNASSQIIDTNDGSTVTVTATALNNTKAGVAGLPISFEITDPALTGVFNISGSVVTTDAKGDATITLQTKSLTSAQKDKLIKDGVNVTAKLSDNRQAALAQPIKAAKVATLADVAKVTLITDVNTLSTTKGDKITLTALVRDKDNNGLANLPVNFAIPDIKATGILNNGALNNVMTNANGEAKLELSVGDLSAEQKFNLQTKGFKVDATAGTFDNQTSNEIKQSRSASVVLNTNAGTAISQVQSLVVNASSQIIDTNDGSTVTVTATALNNAKAGVAGLPISFEITDPALTGVFNISGSVVTTDAKGDTTITLQTKSLTSAQKDKLIKDGVNVTAKLSDNRQAALAQPIKAAKVATLADVAKVTLITDVNTLSTTKGDKITLTALVRDKDNNGLANLPVNFAIPNIKATGILNNGALNNVMTNANGEAKLELSVGDLSAEQKLYLQSLGLQLQATSGDKTDQITLRTKEGAAQNTARTVLLSTNFNNIKTEIGTKIKVKALVLDANNTIVANAPVSFGLPLDTGLVNNTANVVNTNDNGEAEIEVEIKTLTPAQKARLDAGVSITASTGNATGTTTITGSSNNSGNIATYNFFVSQSKSTLRTGSDTMTLDIHVTDIHGGIVKGVPVFLQLLNDGVKNGLSFNNTSQLLTDDQGNIKVDLVQSDIGLPAKLEHNAVVKVMVNDGVHNAEDQTLTINVIGTHVQNPATSAASIADNDNVTLTGQVVDGRNQPIANTNIELLNNNQDLAAPLVVRTDASGKFSYNASTQSLGADSNGRYPLAIRIVGTDKNNQPISSQTLDFITLTRITAGLSLSVNQNGQNVANNSIEVGNATPTQVVVNLPADIADGTDVFLSTNKGTIGNNGASRVSVKANNRQAIFNNIQSTSPGVAKLTVEYNGQTQLESSLTFVTTQVAKLLLQIENATVLPNGETKVIATVKDSNDAPIPNALVEFSNIQDASTGSLSSGYALTDASGIATISYFAGSTSTPNDGVIIRAAVNSVKIGNGYIPARTPQRIDKTLTVQDTAAYIGFGFSDTLQSSPDNIYYNQAGSIFVNNNIGQPAVNQVVSVAITPVAYGLGMWYVIPAVPAIPEVPAVPDDPSTPQNEYRAGKPAVPETPAQWALQHFEPNTAMNSTSRTISLPGSVTCNSEDINHNTILDAGEDKNQNGLLDPLNPVTLLSPSGSILTADQMKTDNTGKLNFIIRYNKQYAGWFVGQMKVTTRVNGSEYVSYRNFGLTASNDDVKLVDENQSTRPNWTSPFGTFLKYKDDNGFCY